MTSNYRLEQSNVLFLGVYGAILIVYFSTTEGFVLINKIEDFSSDEISHMKYLDGYLYLSFPSSTELFKVGFPKLHLSACTLKQPIVASTDSKLLSALTARTTHSTTLASSVDTLT